MNVHIVCVKAAKCCCFSWRSWILRRDHILEEVLSLSKTLPVTNVYIHVKEYTHQATSHGYTTLIITVTSCYCLQGPRRNTPSSCARPFWLFSLKPTNGPWGNFSSDFRAMWWTSGRLLQLCPVDSLLKPSVILIHAEYSKSPQSC